MCEARTDYDLARVKADWTRTASLMALIANANRDKKKRSRPYTPADFDPFAGQAEEKIEVGIEALKVFLPPSP